MAIDIYKVMGRIKFYIRSSKTFKSSLRAGPAFIALGLENFKGKSMYLNKNIIGKS